MISMRDHGDLNEAGGLKDGRKVEFQIFDGREYEIAKKLDLGSVRKRGVKDTSMIFSLSNWKNNTVIY